MINGKKWIGFLLMELYALVLASMQFLHSVKTDEAKYLLNIPYPHPPLARFILHLTDSWPFQEFFWRFVFATLCIQAVRLVWKLSHDLKPQTRLALSILWLGNTAIIFQAGSIMMAPLTALEAWIFVYLYLRDDDAHDNAGFIALWWLASLFTAYQAVLFAPIVWTLLRRNRLTIFWHIIYLCVPLGLLCLYTLTNPLSLASMLIHTDHTPVSLLSKLEELMMVWFLGGSIVLSVVGLYGVIRNHLWAIFISALLVSAYIFLARFDYYAILFLPLSMAGAIAMLRKRQISPMPVAAGVVACSALLFIRSLPLITSDPAYSVMQILNPALLQSEHVTGPILVKGAFGHEWQYQSHLPILRYNADLLPKAGAVVCISMCDALDLSYWRQINDHPIVYVKR